MRKKIVVVLATVLLLTVVFTGCQQQSEQPGQPTDGNDKPVVTFTMQNGDVFKAELYPEIAPNTVNNFISLVNQKFYDGLTFHRIIPGFMAQGGDPKGDGTGDAGYDIRGEFAENGFTNELKHTEGVLSMARSGYPNTAGSQFFIMDKDIPFLDGKYASFGKITEGLEKFKNLMSTELTDDIDEAGNTLGIPVENPVIESVTVDTKGKTYPEPRKFNFTTDVPDYDKDLPIVTIEMENGETIELELYPQLAPNTVNNFISLIKQGYYDGLTFHRIIPEFMVQGGDPVGNGTGGPGYSIKEEFNNLSHTSGILSMARSGHVDSAGSQFFIIDMDVDAMFLDGNYTAFGKVINGEDTVRGISRTPLINVQMGAPETPPVMKKVTVDTKGVEYPEPEKITE